MKRKEGERPNKKKQRQRSRKPMAGNIQSRNIQSQHRRSEQQTDADQTPDNIAGAPIQTRQRLDQNRKERRVNKRHGIRNAISKGNLLPLRRNRKRNDELHPAIR